MQNPYLRRKRLARYRANVMILILFFIAVILVSILLSNTAGAQTPSFDTPGGSLCLYRPASVLKNPLQKSVVVYGRAYNYLRPVDAVRYVSDLYGTDSPFLKQEMDSAAIQYSIKGSLILGQTRVAAWLDGQLDVPNLTLSQLVNSFLMTGNPQQRIYLGSVLQRVLRSEQNDGCNPATEGGNL
jgi:hypothetical protein